MYNQETESKQSQKHIGVTPRFRQTYFKNVYIFIVYFDSCILYAG